MAGNGSKIVVKNTLRSGIEHLPNKDIYAALPCNPTLQVHSQMRAFVEQLYNNGFMDKHTCTFPS